MPSGSLLTTSYKFLLVNSQEGNESLVTSVGQMPMSTKTIVILQWQINNNKQQQEATYIGQQQQTTGFAAGSKSYSVGSTITYSIHGMHKSSRTANTSKGRNLVNSRSQQLDSIKRNNDIIQVQELHKNVYDPFFF